MSPFRTQPAETPTWQNLSNALSEGLMACILPAGYNLAVKLSHSYGQICVNVV